VRSGFFTIYKPGQGYWTRLGTAIAAGLVILLTIHFLWTNLRPWLTDAFTPASPTAEQGIAAAVKARNVTLGVCIATGVALGALTWWMMNKPANADFLIATDSEMKKVNWTSKKDLIGSTKVVIGFMFLIAFFLFVVDVLFGYFFYFIRVLKTPPF
jgi:preprotein translocase SecE subunit